jgi:predicted anti-sigma-YlaC factor YlaD
MDTSQETISVDLFMLLPTLVAMGLRLLEEPTPHSIILALILVLNLIPMIIATLEMDPEVMRINFVNKVL